MDIIEACNMIAAAEFRPFTKDDYYGFAGVSEAGPHEIADLPNGALAVRDGKIIEIFPLGLDEDDLQVVRLAIDGGGAKS